jgi:hypothetical protein
MRPGRQPMGNLKILLDLGVVFGFLVWIYFAVS